MREGVELLHAVREANGQFLWMERVSDGNDEPETSDAPERN